MKKMQQFHPSEGFTIVEVIVTLAVVTLFLTGFFQAYLLLESQRINVARQAKASDIAYSNLRKFSTRPAGLTCDPATMDLTNDTPVSKNDKEGKLLGDETNTTTSSAYGFLAEPTDVTRTLGASTQTVSVFAPNGCANFDSSPIKIVSTVTYGTNGGEVTHASFVQ